MIDVDALGEHQVQPVAGQSVPLTSPKIRVRRTITSCTPFLSLAPDADAATAVPDTGVLDHDFPGEVVDHDCAAPGVIAGLVGAAVGRPIAVELVVGGRCRKESVTRCLGC